MLTAQIWLSSAYESHLIAQSMHEVSDKIFYIVLRVVRKNSVVNIIIKIIKLF